MRHFTRVLDAATAGDPKAASELLPLVYDELRKLAAHQVRRERPGQTLQATALVHEAYLRLMADGSEKTWQHRGHFFAAAAEAMRRILVEQARRKQATKHGGDVARVEYQEAEIAIHEHDDRLIDLDEALRKLAEDSPQEAELVKLRYFTGLTIEEAADVLGITRNVAYRYWTYAKAFLTSALSNYRDPN